MAAIRSSFLVALSLSLLIKTSFSLEYDSSYTLQCTSTPEPPLYGGGILVNPELNDDHLNGWAAAGNALIGKVRSADGNNFVVVSNIRRNESDGLSQTFSLDKYYFYTVSAWLQVSVGEAAVQVKVVTSTGNRTAGWITAKSGCWTMLKGGFTGNFSGSADLRFEIYGSNSLIWKADGALDDILYSHSINNFTKSMMSNNKLMIVKRNNGNKKKKKKKAPSKIMFMINRFIVGVGEYVFLVAMLN